MPPPTRSCGGGRTDERGEFSLTLREGGRFYLRAEAAGFAPGEAGPFELDPTAGAEDLEVLVGRGGSIEGRVVVHAGEEPAGIIVGLSRGDTFGVTQRTDANGRFRFDGLTPGPWQVEWRQDEIRTGSTTSYSKSVEEKPASSWTCRVREGETTFHTLDLRSLRGATLHGRLLLGGEPPEGWKATLSPVDGAGDEARAATLDPDGRFTITTSSVGASDLILEGLVDRTSRASASVHLDVRPGANDWELDLPAGTIHGRIDARLVELDSVMISWADRDRASFWVRVVPSFDGRFTLSRFPAGDVHAHWTTKSGEPGERSVSVAENRSLDLTIP